jgi:RNA polymerase sigma-70 factor (ECF subfamily)
MKKTCETFGSDGKGNGRALRPTKFGAALNEYLATKGDEAWGFAYGLCRDQDEAGELVQEACYRALKAERRYDASKPIKSWLFSILRHAFIDSRRRWERLKGRSMNGPAEGPAQDWDAILSDGEESAQTHMERTEEAAAVRAAMMGLPGKYREALRLCCIEQMRYEDAAAKLGIPAGTVRSRLARARAALRGDPAIRRLS